MKQLLLGFIFGVIVCLILGNAVYKPYRGVVINKYTINPIDIQIQKNQEAIFNLIELKCGK